MQLLTTRGNISIHLFNPTFDVPNKVAKDVARIEGNAYKVRFSKIPEEFIDARYKVGKATNIQATSRLLKNADWYWLFAYQRNIAVGYGLFKASIKNNDVWVVELHTDLTVAPKKRVGTLLLHEGLKLAEKQVDQAWLCVDKSSPEEHFPYEWYRRLGFKPTDSEVEEFKLGDFTLKKYTLRGKLKEVLARTKTRVS